MNMKQINRYKKFKFYVKLITLPTFLVVLIVFLMTIFKNDIFGTDDLVVVTMIIIFTLIVVCMFMFLDIYRYKVIKDQYGLVTKDDRLIAKDLLLKIDDLYDNEYDVLNNRDFQEYEESSKYMLKELIKGRKLYKGLSQIYIKAQETINEMDDKDKNKYPAYSDFLATFVELISRNQSDI